MQAQLADLDAMWSVVNAPKREHTAGGRVCHLLDVITRCNFLNSQPAGSHLVGDS